MPKRGLSFFFVFFFVLIYKSLFWSGFFFFPSFVVLLIVNGIFKNKKNWIHHQREGPLLVVLVVSNALSFTA